MVNYLYFLREIEGSYSNQKNKLKSFSKNEKKNDIKKMSNLGDLFYQMKRIEEIKGNDFLYFIKGFDQLNKGVVSFAHFISALNISGLFLEKDHEN